MPQVPYLPVPDVAPTNAGTPRLNVSAPAAAFGGAVGEALKGAGANLEHAGNEIFSRAIAIQNLRNETEAKEADANYMIATGEKHAEFSSLQGKAAVDAYPKYVQDLQDLRKNYRDTLSNPMAQKMFDSSALQNMSRTIFNGAGHAAQQDKVYSNNTSKARVDALKDSALGTPTDEKAFQQSIEKTRSEVQHQGEIGGWSKEQTDNQTNHDISGLWTSRIIGLAKDNPFKAKDMFEANRNQILFQDQEKADRVVTSQLHTAGSRNISDAVNAGWAPYMKSSDADKAVGVQEPLVRIVKEAQRAHPEIEFTIGGQGGRRTPQEQAVLVAQGRSQTYNSNHLTGGAIDLVPLKNGQPDYNDMGGYAKIEAAIKEASEKLGIPLSGEHDKIKSWDQGHYSIPRDLDMKSVPKAVEEPLQNRVDRAMDYAKQRTPDDGTFHDFVRDRVITDFSRAKSIQRDADYTNTNTIDGALVGNYANGKIPSSVEELKALDPRVEAAWNNLDETKQKKVIKDLSTQKATKDDLSRYQELKGMAENHPEEFSQVDITGEKNLRDATKKELINLQLKKYKDAQADPKVTHALGILKPTIEAARFDKEQKNKFTGALQDALVDAQSKSGKPPNAKEIQEIGARLLQDQVKPGWLWNSTQKTFEVPVPDNESEKIKADPYWAQRKITPSDEMIQRIYTQQLYQKLYGGASKEAK